MARGRPPGTKNKSSHSAGGDRRSSKYKKQQAAKQARGRQHIADAFANARRQQLETPQWKEHPLSKNNFKASQKLLAKVLDHPSMPKGKSVPTRGIIDQRSDNWDISYDIPSTTNEEESDGFYRRVLIPPAGTPLRTYLDEAKAHIEKNEDRLSEQSIRKVNWLSLARAMKALPANLQRWTPKHISGMTGVGKFLAIWNRSAKSSCPRCSSCPVEDHLHTAAAEWSKRHLALRTWMQTQQTAPEIEAFPFEYLKTVRQPSLGVPTV